MERKLSLKEICLHTVKFTEHAEIILGDIDIYRQNDSVIQVNRDKICLVMTLAKRIIKKVYAYYVI